MSIILLGPSKWREGYRPAQPPVADLLHLEGLPGESPDLASPLAIRASLAWGLREVEGVRATLMELHARRPGETHSALFHRVCHERKVDGYFVFWPFGAQRAGLDIELGFLLARFAQGQDLDVRIFIETGKHAAARVDHGHLEILERGLRTRYYEDLVAYGSSILEWTSYEELWEGVFHASRDWLNET